MQNIAQACWEAIDDAYPLYGAVVTEPAGDLEHLLAKRGETFGGFLVHAAAERLGGKLAQNFGGGNDRHASGHPIPMLAPSSVSTSSVP